MSRGRRVIHPGTPYHLISRFVASEWFIRTSHERQCYLQEIGDALAQSDWRCFSFAIMSNHIHLGVVAGEETLASWLRGAHSRFAEWINTRHERIGAVFVRGPKAFAIRPDGVGTLISYIHQNPVRAGVVSHPAMSDWTSHAAYVGLVQPPSWLDTELGLELSGWQDGAEMDRVIGASSVLREQAHQALQNPPRPRGRPRAQLQDIGAEAAALPSSCDAAEECVQAPPSSVEVVASGRDVLPTALFASPSDSGRGRLATLRSVIFAAVVTATEQTAGGGRVIRGSCDPPDCNHPVAARPPR